MRGSGNLLDKATLIVIDLDLADGNSGNSDGSCSGIGVDAEKLSYVNRVDALGSVDGEDECDDAVATLNSLSLVGVLPAGSIGVALPCVTVIGSRY